MHVLDVSRLRCNASEYRLLNFLIDGIDVYITSKLVDINRRMVCPLPAQSNTQQRGFNIYVPSGIQTRDFNVITVHNLGFCYLFSSYLSLFFKLFKLIIKNVTSRRYYGVYFRDFYMAANIQSITCASLRLRMNIEFFENGPWH
jgi:hypothetical protein